MKKKIFILLSSLAFLSSCNAPNYLNVKNKITDIKNVFVMEACVKKTYSFKDNNKLEEFCNKFKTIKFKNKNSYIKCTQDIIVFEKNGGNFWI